MMRPRSENGHEITVPDDVAAVASRLAAQKVPWTRIEAVTGYSCFVLRKRLDPSFAAKQAAKEHARNRHRPSRRGERRARVPHFSEGQHLPPEESARALATVPADTRSWMARMMGDPLPGRSALDRRGGKLASPHPEKIAVAGQKYPEHMEDRHSNVEAVD